MDLNATELLKEAMLEKIDQLQMIKISRGCKLITEILPFQERA